MISRTPNSGTCPYCQHRHPPTFGSIRCDDCGRRFTGDPMADRIPFWVRWLAPVALILILMIGVWLTFAALL
ncbi:hypothetical protein [Tropicimonas aquimaris]|uniref:Uncharacterized protein n=1 Tax=Tropicimonas aquimaris TaxID=914152 RepID=A0ABW3IMI3_9RHOB